MPGKIKVDKAVLDGAADSLKGVRSEFEGCVKARESLEGSLGSGDIADAMREFTDNWDRHRKQLVERMGKAESGIRSAAASFHQQDVNTAGGLQQGSTSRPTYRFHQTTVTQGGPQ